ncbi:helix-hairpin-helix domain-containing protein [Treponema endosymbiont of Eucomonympha sp.]|uniref:helix-hairpin-helix domain-containing protein n=2 Tax=Treponema endosymbiont of Eucomonympha sp. TaxID=1580831 RepID=UPI000781CDAB|nr:helix-hairpin-helix domain-containing protein [Treponema endosymbiont of Eucomonympha sp.]
MAAQRKAELERLVARYQDAYYNGEAKIPDAEFDALWDELRRLDPANALFRRVGADSGSFPKARHRMPMGSQEKAANPGEFLKWTEKRSAGEYLVEYKLDGASLELQYEGGVLARAVTRGDGAVGDDITPNARKMRGVLPALLAGGAPLPLTGGVRGEVMLFRDVRRKRFADKANCRNAANGLMKRKDGEGSEHLSFIAYDAWFQDEQGCATAESQPFADEAAKVEWLASCGFTAVPLTVRTSAEEVIAYREEVMAQRASLDYDIDGLVVKERQLDFADASRARPERQIAFKFNPEEAVTAVRSVEWSESGATYTPIAVFDAVELAGTTVQRASLVNPDTIRALGVKIGSRVVVTKRGEIIPKIERVVPAAEPRAPCAAADGTAAADSRYAGSAESGFAMGGVDAADLRSAESTAHEPERKPDSPAEPDATPPVIAAPPCAKSTLVHECEPEREIEFPAACAACGTPLADDGSRLCCPNRECPKRIHHRLEKWVAALDVRDFGETLLRNLFQSGRVRSVSDLYTLTEAELAPYFLQDESLAKDKKSKGAGRVFASLSARRHIRLAQFVAGFDIEGIGETLVEKLVEAGFATLDSLLEADAESIAAVNGFGDITAAALVEGLRENREEMRRLVDSGALRLTETARAGKLAGKSFCFTGELQTLKRADAERRVKEAGGSTRSGVTKGLSYLVTNDAASGSGKNKKAAELGVTLIDEQAFLELLAQAESGVRQ